jgi:hypothetical protein
VSKFSKKNLVRPVFRAALQDSELCMVSTWSDFWEVFYVSFADTSFEPPSILRFLRIERLTFNIFSKYQQKYLHDWINLSNLIRLRHFRTECGIHPINDRPSTQSGILILSSIKYLIPSHSLKTSTSYLFSSIIQKILKSPTEAKKI